MARIRTIKPSFFKNEELAELPMTARLLYIGLWTQADCEGRLEDRPKRLKAELFPYDNVNIEELLLKLQSAGFITKYRLGDLKLISIPNFSKHQRISGSEAGCQSEFPAPEEEGSILEAPWKHLGSTEDDRKGREGKGKERKGKEDTFVPPDLHEVVLYFLENGYPEKTATKAFNYYAVADWKDSKGNKVKNWKQKMQSVWFKDENKEENTGGGQKGKFDDLIEQTHRINEERRNGYSSDY